MDLESLLRRLGADAVIFVGPDQRVRLADGDRWHELAEPGDYVVIRYPEGRLYES